jgi:hypothetical protein
VGFFFFCYNHIKPPNDKVTTPARLTSTSLQLLPSAP